MRLVDLTPAVALAVAAATSSTALAGVFGAGNILVERMGDGTTTLGSAATGTALVEYTSAGSNVQTIGMTGSNLITDSGSATSNGYFGV